MYVAELFTEGVPTKEWVKRAERVKGAKRMCKGAGCLTRISAYNLDMRGKPEKLCYKCQGKKDELVKPSRPIECKQGHLLSEVGMKKGRCAQCQKEYDQERWRKKAETDRKSDYPLKAYLVLHGLAELMRVREIKCWGLGKALDIPSRSITGYAQDGVGCPPDRALKIADYFGVSVEELCNQDQEVAM